MTREVAARSKRRQALWFNAAGAAAARTGDEMSGPALLLAGLAVTGSAATASTLLAGIMVAAALGGPLLGVLLDRSARPGHLLAAALAGYASALAIILVSLDRVPFFVTVAIAVGAGLLGPALTGGWTSQLSRIVAPEDLPRANALDAMTFNVASLAGPALAGTVAGLAGASAGVVVSIALICLALPSARALTVKGTPARTPPATSVGADLAAGVRAIACVPSLARATTTSVISCVSQGMLIACSPLLGVRAFGAASHGVVLLAGIAATALVANGLLSRHPHAMSPDTIMWSSTTALTVALVLAATCRPVALVAAVAVAGVGQGPQLTALFAVRHREAPAHLRSQIFTTGASLKITGFALGAGVAGPLATWSLPGALLVAAAVQVLALLGFAAFTRACRTATRPPEAAVRERVAGV